MRRNYVIADHEVGGYRVVELTEDCRMAGEFWGADAVKRARQWCAIPHFVEAVQETLGVLSRSDFSDSDLSRVNKAIRDGLAFFDGSEDQP